MKYLILAHVAVFITQLLTFHSSGVVLDPHALFGPGSRILQNGIDIRAAGLFQEANSYCTNLLLLASIAIFLRLGRPTIFLAALTMVVSSSLWGIAAAAIIMAASEFRDDYISCRRLLAYAASLILLAGAFNIFLWVAKPPSYPMPIIYWRVSEIAHDPSLLARYVGTMCELESVYGKDGQLVSLFLGEGLTTKYFLQCLPANGFAFLFRSFGLLGGLSLFASVSFAFHGLKITSRTISAVYLIFLFTTYPLATYLIFWIWLWMTFSIARADAVSVGSDGDIVI